MRVGQPKLSDKNELEKWDVCNTKLLSTAILGSQGLRDEREDNITLTGMAPPFTTAPASSKGIPLLYAIASRISDFSNLLIQSSKIKRCTKIGIITAITSNKVNIFGYI
jgi:hypothetical protein